MTHDDRNGYITRESVLKLLSDAEVSSVSNAETAERLIDGDEYLDLGELQYGVQRASAASAEMGRVLPRKAVLPATWSKMLTIVERESHRGVLPPGAVR